MSLKPKLTESLLELERGYSRPQIAKIATGAGAAIPSSIEFAMAQQGMTGMRVNAAMATHKVHIGRTWAEWREMARSVAKAG